jgi:hypothetical protein
MGIMRQRVSNRERAPSKLQRLTVLAGLLLAAGGLGYSAWYQAPVNDEFGHFYAGLRYWQFGDTQTFRVNSPWLRSMATLPAYLAGMECGQHAAVADSSGYARPEFGAGRQLFIQDPQRFQFWLSVGRMLVLATTLLGGLLLYRIAVQQCAVLDQPGRNASCTGGVIAAGLWWSQPQILSHGVLITGDVFCAVCMLTTVVVIRWAMRQLTGVRSLALGGMLALAVLAKFTAIVLLPLTLLVFAWHADRYTLRRLLGCFAAAVLAMLFVLGMPYGFEGWGKNWWEYRFLSHSLGDFQSQLRQLAEWVPGMERLWLPVPVPEQLLLGLDRQQVDFENGLPSYAAGLRSNRGWWWFYLYSMLVKLPLGTLAGLALTGVLLLARWKRLGAGLGLPLGALALMIGVTCMQSGFAQQHRYILPAYPFMFWIMSVVVVRAWFGGEPAMVEGSDGDGRQRKTVWSPRWGQAIALCAIVSLVGSVSVAPHWLSAFNAAAGGNRSGFKCMFNDASDWGQDSYRVRDWINAYAASGPIYVRSSFSGHAELRAVGTVAFEDARFSVEEMPRPSWLVVSKSDYAIDASLENQLEGLPVAEWIGGTHMVYFLQGGARTE